MVPWLTHSRLSHCRFKGGEQKLMDGARHVKDDVKEGMHKFGEAAEHDLDR